MAPPFLLHRHACRDARDAAAAARNEAFHVMAFVAAHGLAAVARQGLQQFQRRVALRRTGGVTDFGFYDQAVTVFHDTVALIAQDRAGAGGLAVQADIRIGHPSLRPLSPGPSSFGRKLLHDAQAWIRVPDRRDYREDRHRPNDGTAHRVAATTTPGHGGETSRPRLLEPEWFR